MSSEELKEDLISEYKPIKIHVAKRLDPSITQSLIDDKSKGYVYYQDQKLTLKQSIQIHFKPSDSDKSCLYFQIFLLDTMLSIAFQSMHIYFFLTAEFA